MKNYFEHEVKVRYVEALLLKQKDWNWFIKHIEENFELMDISTWDQFLDKKRHLQAVYICFVKISELDNVEIHTESELLLDMFDIALFYNGKRKRESIENSLRTNYGKVLHLIIWITKLLNIDNGTTYVSDLRYILQYNYWEIIKQDDFLLEAELVKEYADGLEIESFDEVIKCLHDNINMVMHPVRPEFLEKYKSMLVSSNVFSYQSYERMENMTWEEDYLLKMSEVSVQNGELHPVWISSDGSYPDTTLWTDQIIEKMKEYFHCEEANFVLETVSYFLHKKKPSAQVMLMHCELLRERICNYEKLSDFFCSSYEVVSCLFKDKYLSEVKQSLEYKEMIRELLNIRDPEIIKRNQDKFLPLSPEQKSIIIGYYQNQYKEIDNVTSSNELLKYLENENVTKRIDNKYFDIVCKKFYELIPLNRDILVATLFYQYMVFLIKVKGNSPDVEKYKIQMQMVIAQKEWQDKYYDIVFESMNKSTYETSILREALNAYNESILENPFVVAQNSMLVSDDEICNAMESVSEQALTYMVSRYQIDRVYPMKMKQSINYERHDVDRMLKEIVERIKDERGYRLLNVLETDTYINAIHENYEYKALSFAAMFHMDKELYQMIQEKEKVELLPYEGKLYLAHVTQLFPILETRIRELGALVAIVPFKENLEEFMQFKDPSSILREILQMVYNEVNSFETVSDILFVYNYMYNGNSCNIRNECIHGRNYYSSNLNIAFKLTLISLYMVIFRLEGMKRNLNLNEEGNY